MLRPLVTHIVNSFAIAGNFLAIVTQIELKEIHSYLLVGVSFFAILNAAVKFLKTVGVIKTKTNDSSTEAKS